VLGQAADVRPVGVGGIYLAVAIAIGGEADNGPIRGPRERSLIPEAVDEARSPSAVEACDVDIDKGA